MKIGSACAFAPCEEGRSSYQVAEAGRSGGSEHPIPSKSCSPARAYGQALQPSPQHILHHRLIQREIRHKLFQRGVLVLQLLQPPHHVTQQAFVLLLSIEVRRLRNTRLAADLRNGMPYRTLLQNQRLLRVRKLGCLHRFPLLPVREIRAENSNLKFSSFQGAEHSLDRLPLDLK